MPSVRWFSPVGNERQLNPVWGPKTQNTSTVVAAQVHSKLSRLILE